MDGPKNGHCTIHLINNYAGSAEELLHDLNTRITWVNQRPPPVAAPSTGASTTGNRPSSPVGSLHQKMRKVRRDVY